MRLRAPLAAYVTLLVLLAPSATAAQRARPESGQRAAHAPDSGSRARVGHASPGPLADKPDGSGPFFRDPHAGGQASEVRIVSVAWGRLVDVHALSADGLTLPGPVFRDFAIGEAIQSDGADYRLETNPATARTRLVILRPPGAEFLQLLQRAEEALVPLATKGPNDPGPFGHLPRNGTLVVQLDDLLEDGAQARADLVTTVRVHTGLPPTAPFRARVTFDAHHGGVRAGAFHSTRVLIDATTSELEAGALPAPAPVNQLGLPASTLASAAPNVLLSIPTRVDLASGQPVVLTNLSGAPLATSGNGPVASGTPTEPVLRAARAGNQLDASRGFLLDLEPPQVLGRWPVEVLAAAALREPPATPRFALDLRFASSCRRALAPGQVLVVGGAFLEVLRGGVGPDPAGVVSGVRAVLVAGSLPAPAALVGAGLLVHSYDASLGAEASCWVRASPAAGPGGTIATATQFALDFSEPMEPEALSAFDDLRVLHAPAGTPASATNTVVAVVQVTPSLQGWTVSPLLPLAHQQGISERVSVELLGVAPAGGCGGVSDLAGNGLAAVPPPAEFALEASQPGERNGGLALRFASPDELAPFGLNEVRGQVFLDLGCGTLRPRPVTHGAHPVDGSNPVPGLMLPFPPGVQTPLNPLGAKLQAVWRYADLGWAARDETRHDVDVEGLAWTPVGGLVSADFFEEFEIALGHSKYLPDEDISTFLLPKYPASGLAPPPNPFSENVLTTQEVVHPRALGYRISPADLFTSPTGRPLLPYPLNRAGAPYRTFTWRDTTVVEAGGPNGAGVPLDVESGVPLHLVPSGAEGSLYPAGNVRSVGLPLLMEFRCFPSSTGLGLNPLDIALAVNSSANPFFRVYSAGGVDAAGRVIVKDPDLEPVPTGGFNPSSIPPGRPTRPADNSSYRGQLDVVVRVSRAHTVWLDSGAAAPSYLSPVVEARTPDATRIVLDFRGATALPAGTAPFDAGQISPYGSVPGGGVSFASGTPAWSSAVSNADGGRWLQARLTFVNDVGQGTSAELDSLGVAFVE